MDGTQEGRRRPTLSRQFSVADSANLRSLLKAGDSTAAAAAAAESVVVHPARTGETRTLATVLAREKREMSSSSSSSAAPAAFSRTLLDIIKEEKDPHGVLIGSGNGGSHRISWKSFKDRLRLRRASAAWSESVTHSSSTDESFLSLPLPGSPRPISILDVPITSTTLSAPEVPVPENTTTTTTTTATTTTSSPTAEEEPIRVSLMALLEQTDRMGGVGEASVATAVMGMVAAAEEEEEEEEEGEGEGMVHVCCVCMVRHKGSAFIPCGHTFCRLCSRELWVSRGNCPLCNGFILEILDIF